MIKSFDLNNNMPFRFPINDVVIKITTEKTTVTLPLYTDNYSQINQQEFSLNVEGVAYYYASNGTYIEVTPYKNYNLHSLELYLNGSIYGAILHQRLILPFHGSCFHYNDCGIMVCGESGAGKSSTTAAFSFKGADFLTDDVTPIVFTNNKPQIWAISDRIKLWDDSLVQLKKNKNGLYKIGPETPKYYFPMQSDKGNLHTLHQIFLLEIHEQKNVLFQAVVGINKYVALRKEIYRKEYMLGMAASEGYYFKQITAISNQVKITKVYRPKNIQIEDFCSILKEFIQKNN